MKPRRMLVALSLLALLAISAWVVLAQAKDDEEKLAIVGVITDLVNGALARDVEAIKANTDMPLLVIEGIRGISGTLKEEELEAYLQMMYVPAGVTLEVGKADVLLMGSTASAQIELVQPGGPDLALSGRCACLLVKKDGTWKVKAVAYYGY